MSPLEVQLRPGKELDTGFILSGWTKEHLRTQWARDCGRVYHAEHKALILRLLGSCSTVVAHLADDEDALTGFRVSTPPRDGVVPCIHYVYVRPEMRRQGIARRLLDGVMPQGMPHDVGPEFSHKPCVPGLVVPSSWTFNPYRAFSGCLT